MARIRRRESLVRYVNNCLNVSRGCTAKVPVPKTKAPPILIEGALMVLGGHLAWSTWRKNSEREA